MDKRLQNNSNKIFLAAIPAFLNYLTQVLQFFPGFISPTQVMDNFADSTYFHQNFMYFSGNLVVIVLLSIFYLKRKLHRQHYLGIFINFTIMITIGFMVNNYKTYYVYRALEIFFYALSWFSYAAQLSLEEKLYSKHFLNPAQLAGYEGIFGIFFAFLGILISNFTECNQGQGIYNLCKSGVFDDFPLFMKQIFSFDAPGIFFLAVGIIILNIFSICAGQVIIKQISALTRVISDSNSLLLSSILYPITGYQLFEWQYLFFYLICIAATLVFCEIIVLPCFGFDKNRGHGVVTIAVAAPQALVYQQQSYQNQNQPQQNSYNFHNQNYQNYNSTRNNNQVVVNGIQNNKQDHILYQPFLQADINLATNQQQNRPSYANQQQTQNQNIFNNPNNLNLNQLNLKATKEVLKEIKSMQFENLAQIKQIIVLLEDIDSKISQQEHSLRSNIAKILQNIAGVLMKNYSNTIKMKMVKLVLEDQYKDVSKINEMRYIQDRLYFLVSNTIISTKCISEIISWIENNIQPSALNQATQNIQQVNEQFFTEQQRDQQESVSNWREKYQVMQQKLKHN
ncbi:hypothetical protein ABPG72_001432 [Tetrahymena utriculariae]